MGTLATKCSKVMSHYSVSSLSQWHMCNINVRSYWERTWQVPIHHRMLGLRVKIAQGHEAEVEIFTPCGNYFSWNHKKFSIFTITISAIPSNIIYYYELSSLLSQTHILVLSSCIIFILSKIIDGVVCVVM